MLSLYKSQWQTCVFQSWIQSFNHDNPNNLAFPTWVSLRNLPFEHFDQVYMIVGCLGEIIGMESSNEDNKDPMLCINLEIGNGWVMTIALESKGEFVPPQVVDVDDDSIPMRCRICLSWKHQAKWCEGLENKTHTERQMTAKT